MTTIRVADYIFRRLREYDVDHVFMISGGGAMFLNDAVGRTPGLKYSCNHHEQACAIAAESYARASGKPGVLCVTAGPGGTNALTGTVGSWLDSVPTLTISGQVKFETTIASCPGLGLRQLGDQEINIVDIVRPVTKYAVMVTDPKTIRYHLERAIYLATHGRPGPAWLDVPLNVQSSLIDPAELVGYDELQDRIEFDAGELDRKVGEVGERLKRSKKPLIVAGQGIRIAGAVETLNRILDRTGIPVSTTFNGSDLLPTDHPNYIGRIGTIGERSGNFALQNADLLISIGSRNNFRQTGYNRTGFAENAYKIVVDIDRAELLKPGIRPDLPIWGDAGIFLDKWENALYPTDGAAWRNWLAWCRESRQRYPVVLPEYETVDNGVQPYYFVRRLTEATPPGTTFVAANATANISLFQAGVVKPRQRIIGSSGLGMMGYDLPAAVGAAFGRGGTVVCLAGDGSVMMNLQELATVRHYDLPVKLFVLCNNGYQSIRMTQDNYFEKPYIACTPDSGVAPPDFRKLGEGFAIKSVRLERHEDMQAVFEEVFADKEPVVCSVALTPDYTFAPKTASRKLPDGRVVSNPIDDMFPFLDPEEYAANRFDDRGQGD